MIRNFIKIAWRNITRQKGYTLINLIGLAIGIASCLLIVLWIQQEYSFNRFNKKIDRIYRVIQSGEMNGQGYSSYTIPYSLVPVMMDENPEIETGVRVRNVGGLIFNYDGKVFTENNVLLTEPAFFDIFDYKFISGNPESSLEELHSVIITESTAKRYFGDEDPLGKAIKLNTASFYTVTAVMEDCPVNSREQFDIILPMKILGEQRLTSWSWESSGYVLLKENANLDLFKERILDTNVRHAPDNENPVTIQNLWISNFYNPDGSQGRLETILLFSGIAFVVLIIACINFMNLATAQAAARIREVGVRKVLGATKKELIGQFISESIIMSIIAAILAIMLAEIFLPVFNTMIGRELSFQYNNWLLMTSLATLALLVGLVSGSYPAFYLSSFNPSSVLKAGTKRGGSSRFRNILVIFQFTISIILIFSTLVIYRQMEYIKNKDLGFDRENVISLPVNRFIQEKYPILKETILKNPDVLGVTSSSSDPINVGNVNPALWEGKQDDERILFNFLLIEENFLEFFDIDIIAGRTFNKELESDRDAYILNEAAIKVMEMDDPIGKSFTMYADEGPIIGVTEDFNFQTLDREIGPLIISNKSWWRSDFYVKAAPGKSKEVITFLERTIKEVVPDSPFSFTFLDELLNDYYRDVYQMGKTIQYFAILAIFISCLGLFGLASYITERRTKEIGIRKVLGSSAKEILLLFSRGYVGWIAISTVIAWPIGYYVMRNFLANFQYKTEIDVLIFILSSASALIIAMITVSYKTIRAANANPVEALKYE